MMGALALSILAATLVPGEPVQIDGALLAGLPEAKATLEAHGKKQVCEGPKLASVLGRLGVPQGEKLRGPALAQVIIVRAHDGYEVAFSLGELDPMLGNSQAIIATTCDGHALAMGEGPYRLIVPGEQRPARSVRMASSVKLK